MFRSPCHCQNTLVIQLIHISHHWTRFCTYRCRDELLDLVDAALLAGQHEQANVALLLLSLGSVHVIIITNTRHPHHTSATS